MKEAVIAFVPSISGLTVALEATNGLLKLLFAVGSLVWLGYRIAIARREYNSKR
jgi:hypothetical protein